MQQYDWPLLASVNVQNTLGEGVIWHPQQGTLWWLDIQQAKLQRYCLTQQRLDTWALPERAGSFALLENDPRLLIAFASGFALYDLATSQLTWLDRPEKAVAGNRFNDGRVDRQGRFWAGTMVEKPTEKGSLASLYRLNHDGHSVAVISGLQISNGLCWSPDGAVMYHADSPRREIYAYDFDESSGGLQHRRLFATMPEGYFPDGATVDNRGYLFSAQWGGSCIACYSPNGERVGELPVPVEQPSCVAFAGENLDLLVVTTAREGLSAAELEQQPLAGNLLIYQTPFQGLPESLCQRPDLVGSPG